MSVSLPTIGCPTHIQRRQIERASSPQMIVFPGGSAHVRNLLRGPRRSVTMGHRCCCLGGGLLCRGWLLLLAFPAVLSAALPVAAANPAAAATTAAAWAHVASGDNLPVELTGAAGSLAFDADGPVCARWRPVGTWTWDCLTWTHTPADQPDQPVPARARVRRCYQAGSDVRR